MPKYKKTSAIAKEGLNFVRSVVENNGSLFHKIETDSDLGMDGIIEFIKNEKPTNISIAVQVKTGESYYDKKHNSCAIPVGDHYDYWLNYSLGVLGIVYIPSLARAHWIDIKSFLRNNVNPKEIRISCNRVNQLDAKTYSKLFYPLMIHETPHLSLREACQYYESPIFDESALGLHVLFRRYKNTIITWQKMIKSLRENSADRIPDIIAYYLAHIPWHGDIAHYGEPIKDVIKEYVKKEIAHFDIDTMVKLISLIDIEQGISRGTIGQSVESIVNAISKKNSKLLSIIKDELLPNHVRYFAAIMYAFYLGKKAIGVLKAAVGIDGLDEVLDYLSKYNQLYLY